MLNPIDYLAILAAIAECILPPLVLTVGVLRAMDKMGWMDE